MKTLTDQDIQFCLKKEKDYFAMREYHLKLYEYSRAVIPETGYKNTVDPTWYLRQIQVLSRRFADDLGWYFQETYFLPLRMDYQGLERCLTFIPFPEKIQPPLSWETIVDLIAARVRSDDFSTFGIQHIREQFLNHLHCREKREATMHQATISLPEFANDYSQPLLFHALSLFEAGTPSQLPKYEKVRQQLRQDDSCGTWHSLEATNTEKVIALKAFKNGKVQVNFVSPVEAQIFYQQFCIRKE